jgi:hypothetical protein
VQAGTFRVAAVRRFDEEWLRTHTSIRPRTRELYHQRNRDHLTPVLGQLKLGEITASHVLRVKQRCEAAGLSAWTQRGVLRSSRGSCVTRSNRTRH